MGPPPPGRLWVPALNDPDRSTSAGHFLRAAQTNNTLVWLIREQSFSAEAHKFKQLRF